MKNKLFKYCFLFVGLLSGTLVFAQKETIEVEPDSLQIPKNDKKFQTLFFEALSDRGIENYDKAISTLLDLEQEFEDEPAVYFQLGLNYFEVENYDLALQYFKKTKKYKPNDYDLKVAIFKVYEQQKNYKKTIEVGQVLAKKEPKYHEILANIYLINNQYEKALESLNRADNKLGFNALRDKLRTVIYDAYQKPSLAIDYYTKRITEQPYNPLNAYWLTFYFIKNNQLDKALSVSNTALSKHPRFTRYYVLQTKIYLELEQPTEAISSLEAVVTDRFLEEKHKVEAINYFKAYVETHPEAQDDFVNLLNTASESAEESSSFLDLGLFYFETDKPNSLENFEKALKQNPQDFQILKYISVLQYQLSKYDEAINSTENALDIYPTQAIFMLVKGEALLKLAQYNEAKSVLLEALTYVFEENEMMLNFYQALGEVYTKLNETEKAQEYQNKANALQSKLK